MARKRRAAGTRDRSLEQGEDTVVDEGTTSNSVWLCCSAHGEQSSESQTRCEFEVLWNTEQRNVHFIFKNGEPFKDVLQSKVFIRSFYWNIIL